MINLHAKFTSKSHSVVDGLGLCFSKFMDKEISGMVQHETWMVSKMARLLKTI